MKYSLENNGLLRKLKSRLTDSFIVWFLLSVFMLTTADEWKDWRGSNTPFIHDVDQYYCYLPALFVHHDLKFNFENGYWLVAAPNGQRVPQRTMGMALLYSPFFLVAHFISRISDLPATGYTELYASWVYFGTILYSIIALFFLRLALRYFFSERVTALTLAVIFLGTNLLYYTLGWGEMAHSYLFLLFCMLIYFTIRWHRDQRVLYIALIGLLGGLITLIRPTEALILLIPIIYNVYDKQSLRAKLQLLAGNKVQLLIASLLFFLPLLPQFIYWKILTGSWLFYSYGSTEPFFFNDPKILEMLFSYRKGWLLYTPVMVFALAGMILLRKYAKAFLICVPLFFILSIYVLSSWWCWWYGGAFGMRALVQSYSIFAFPLAAFFTWLLDRRVKFIVLILMMVPFVRLNTFQSWQYKQVIMHWDAMSKDSYWMIFGKKGVPDKDRERYEAALDPPDYESARTGVRR